MYKIKNASPIARTMKRKTDMTAQLARMTQMLIMSLITTNVGTMTELHQGITSRMAETPVPSSRGSSGSKGN
jgi:hypothetical protein